MQGKLYPGEVASPQQVRGLADEYRHAARSLLGQGRPRKPLSWAPSRAVAIHAVELYLGAFLLQNGFAAAAVRGLHHDLAKRTDLAVGHGLNLRKRTVAHLKTISTGREYLVSRYGPELAGNWSQVNRLMATLDEVAKKVTDAQALAPSETIGHEGQ